MRFIAQWLIHKLLVAVALLFVLFLLTIFALRWVNPPVTTFMILQSDADQRYYSWTPIDYIDESVMLAVIASEDQRFAEHAGIDFISIEKALSEAPRDGGVRGASTITQQLTKNLFLWPGRNMVRKGVEAVLSIFVDAILSKRRILELYLNVVEFGPGVYGVGAASQIYFRVLPARLNNSEAALLAAVLPNPKTLRISAPSPYVRERQKWILRQMRQMRPMPQQL
ncbi:MAG: monofunctional biosynthetic peptidoglycan transglycosylase [Gammaproteobacteria bacterium]